MPPSDFSGRGGPMRRPDLSVAEIGIAALQQILQRGDGRLDAAHRGGGQPRFAARLAAEGLEGRLRRFGKAWRRSFRRD